MKSALGKAGVELVSHIKGRLGLLHAARTEEQHAVLGSLFVAEVINKSRELKNKELAEWADSFRSKLVPHMNRWFCTATGVPGVPPNSNSGECSSVVLAIGCRPA